MRLVYDLNAKIAPNALVYDLTANDSFQVNNLPPRSAQSEHMV
jgi:hypothetical protein